MTGRVKPKGLLSPQESDFLRRYSTRIYGAVTQDKATDGKVRNYVLKRARTTLHPSLVGVFNEGIALRVFLEREAPDEADDVAKWVGDMEEDDGLLSEFVKAWVPEDRFELFLNQLLLPDDRYPATQSLSRWSMMLRVLHQHVENDPTGDLVPEVKEALLSSLNEMERMTEGAGSMEVPDPKGGFTYLADGEKWPETEGDQKRELRALRWFRDGDKGKLLTVALTFPVEGRSGVHLSVKWEFNVPALLLMTLAEGFPPDNEPPSPPPQGASWASLINLIVGRFEEYDLAVISEERCSDSPTGYYLDPMKVSKGPDGYLDSDRRGVALLLWRERFSELVATHPLSVVSLAGVPRQIRDAVQYRKGGGGKKSAFTVATKQMIRLGLVEAPPGSRRTVQVTDLGRRVARRLQRDQKEDSEKIVMRGRCSLMANDEDSGQDEDG